MGGMGERVIRVYLYEDGDSLNTALGKCGAFWCGVDVKIRRFSIV